MSAREKPAVALVGAGSMGGAMLRGWLAGHAIDFRRSVLFDPAPSDEMAHLAGEAKVTICATPDAYIAARDAAHGDGGFDSAIIAIKPQIAPSVLPGFAPLFAGSIAVSVMAGIACARLRDWLPGVRLVRAMPNLPAVIGAGAVGLYADDPLSDDEHGLIHDLMSACGLVTPVDREDAIDWITALSGSGPAYFFFLAEVMADAGVELGLEPALAARLARQTLIGAGALTAHDERSLNAMRAAVTSPGGTTAAALSVFDEADGGLRDLARRAMRAAAARAHELSQ